MDVTNSKQIVEGVCVGLELRHEGGGAVMETRKGACKLSQVFIELEDNKCE
jgi:hypothetical protein